jgi:hypothetical protein
MPTAPKDQPPPVKIQAAHKPMSNERRASIAGNACLQRHGSDFYRAIVQQRWNNGK